MSVDAVTSWTLQRRSDTEYSGGDPCKKVACIKGCFAEHQYMKVAWRNNLPDYACHQVQIHHKNIVHCNLCPKRAKQSGETRRGEESVGTNRKGRGLENGPRVAETKSTLGLGWSR